MDDRTAKIREHYAQQAKEFGLSKQSTMKDDNSRDLEIETALRFIKRFSKAKTKLLEVGCGNGYAAEQIMKNMKVDYNGIDFSEEMIGLSMQRNLKGAKFSVGSVTELKFAENSFDIVFAERCIINLNSWEQQKRAIMEIHRVLKKGGYAILIEAFDDGLKNLNEAREALCLEAIKMPWHNVFLEKQKFKEFAKEYFVDMQEKIIEPFENFLSSYYFWTRTVYAALVQGKKEIIYNNKFIEYFKFLPPIGNYSYIQMAILKKK